MDQAENCFKMDQSAMWLREFIWAGKKTWPSLRKQHNLTWNNECGLDIVGKGNIHKEIDGSDSILLCECVISSSAQHRCGCWHFFTPAFQYLG